MYRTTKKRAEMLARMRQAKERKRLNGPAPDYPPILPDHLRTIFIIDRAFGISVQRIDLYKTARRNSYRVEVNGKTWKNMGWSSLLAAVRKGLPRVSATG